MTMRLLAVLALLLTLTGLPVDPRQTARAGGPYIVDVTTDNPDSDPGDGVCNDGTGHCTLRAAIQQASSDPSATITFASAIANQTIVLTDTYGTIIWTGNSIIDVNGAGNNITVSGQGLYSGKSIFRIQGNSNTLRNLTVSNAPHDGIQVTGNDNTLENLVIIGNTDAGVTIHGSASGGNGNTIQSSLIGTPNDTTHSCVDAAKNGLDGIYIDGGADNTVISGNRIVCSAYNGVNINGTPTNKISNTELSNNDIGTDGTSAMGNGLSGIYDKDTIGTHIEGNTLSGNMGGPGVWLFGSVNAVLISNMIGTDETGAHTLPNSEDGVKISNLATNNKIGDASHHNTISGNTKCGIRLTTGASLNTIDNNYIGINASGTAIPNGETGLAIYNGPNNTIGSSSAGISQYISGNAREGIYIEYTNGTKIEASNYIGVGSDNITPRGNLLSGIMLNGTTGTAVRPALVANNGGAGIALVGSSAIGNEFQPRSVYANGGLAIDLGNDGHTWNGAHTPPGPNNWMQYPVITSASDSMISGKACANCLIHLYHALDDPAGIGGGGVYLQEVSALASGDWSIPLPSGEISTSVTLIGVQPSTLDSSEMSPRYTGESPFLYLPLISR
jgi:hypothetical protein